VVPADLKEQRLAGAGLAEKFAEIALDEVGPT